MKPSPQLFFFFSGLGNCFFLSCCLFSPWGWSFLLTVWPRGRAWGRGAAPLPVQAALRWDVPLLSLRVPLSPGGLCLLGAYADSDDEEGEAPEKSSRVADANGSGSADIDSTLANFLAVRGALRGGGQRDGWASPPSVPIRPRVCPLQLTSGCFSQEIDAITAPPQPAEPSAATSSSAPPPTPPRPEPKESGSGQAPAPGGSVNSNGAGSALVTEWQYDTQCSLAGGECGPRPCLGGDAGQVADAGGRGVTPDKRLALGKRR